MNPRADAARSNKAASSHSIADVAVIGGGIVGAAAALAAAQAGLSTVWVVGRNAAEPASTMCGSDSRRDDERDLRVYALGPGTQRFLEGLRVWSQLDTARIAPVFDMRVYGDAEARAALHFGAYEAATERLATIVEHRELSRVLDTAAGYFPGIERIDGFASQVVVDTESVSVTTERGPRLARLVIAADGARSPTREALGIVTHGKAYGQRALLGNFGSAHRHGGTAFQWFTDDGVIALLPLAACDGDAGDAVSLVWSAPDAVADALMRDGIVAMAARLSELAARDPATAIGPFTPLGPLAEVPLAMHSAQAMVSARAVLVGDAAHVIHPLAGQGLNLGLADVEALVRILVARETFRDCGDRVLLRRHERARAEPVFAMRQMTDGLSRLFDSSRPDVARLRGLGMRVLDRATPLKRLLVRQASGSP